MHAAALAVSVIATTHLVLFCSKPLLPLSIPSSPSTTQEIEAKVEKAKKEAARKMRLLKKMESANKKAA